MDHDVGLSEALGVEGTCRQPRPDASVAARDADETGFARGAGRTVDADDVPEFAGDMFTERRVCGLAVTKFFLGRKGKTSVIAKPAVVSTPKACSSEFVLVEKRTGKQIVELLGELCVLELENVLQVRGFNPPVQIFGTWHQPCGSLPTIIAQSVRA